MAAAAVAAQLYIVPALVMGAIIGIIEIIFVHSDEMGMGWLGHSIHAIPTMMLFIFASMNVDWVLSFFHTSEAQLGPMIVIGVRVGIGILAAFKIGAAAAIAGRVGEKMYHSVIIGALVAAAPYLWIYGIGPAITPVWPWKTGFLKI